MGEIIGSIIIIIYLGVVAYLISLAFRLVRAVEKIADKIGG